MSNNSQDSQNQEDKVIIDTSSTNNNNQNFNMEELICKYILIYSKQHLITKT